VGNTLPGWNEPLHLVGETQEADPIVVRDRAEGENGRDLGGYIFLLLSARTEELAAAPVDRQQDRKLAFFNVTFDEWMPHAGSDVPVNCSDVIAGLVFSDLLEGDAGALEDTVVFSPKQVFNRSAGAKMKPANLPKNLG
jgi:hypothetical protein